MIEIKANNPSLLSWIDVPENSDFPIQNIPFGVFKTKHTQPRAATIIGNTVIDLSVLATFRLLDSCNLPNGIFNQSILNDFIALGKQKTREVRNRLSEIFEKDNAELQGNKKLCEKAFFPVQNVELLLPVRVGDYTDFYSSEQHAYNVGCMFRDPDNALLPNWKHIPVGYHGRASSIVVSGTDFHRPKGQMIPNDSEQPVFGACKLLDFELEMAFITHQGKLLGESISTREADEYIFGMCLFNDWSARDIQKWEYVPLGPFLGKNFASSVSPWIVTLDALEPFRTQGPVQIPKVLDYLEYKGNKHIDINLQVSIQPQDSEETIISNSNYKYMYWNMNQQLAHHTVNGCNVNAGDMMASGTISGSEPSSYGSMLELSWKGTKPVKMKGGTERKFIQDFDTVKMRGFAKKDNLRVGFGEVKATILPAI